MAPIPPELSFRCGARTRVNTSLAAHRGRPITEIVGHPDDLKVRSSMTLFVHAGHDTAE